MSGPAAAVRGGRSKRDGCRPVRAAVARWLLGAGLAAWGIGARAAQPTPVMIQTIPGRFEISAADPTLAHGVTAAAEEAWKILGPILGLPETFPSPVYFRIEPREDAKAEAPPFHVAVEIGGLVSTRLRADAATLPMARRALVQSILMRLAVAKHGMTPYLTVPLWLEQACAGIWPTRIDGAQFDAIKQAAARESPPSVEAIVNWKRSEEETRSLPLGSIWLLAFFQAESGANREWPNLLSRLLNGDDPLLAVALSFPGRFSSAEGRELWWRTGYHHLRRVRVLPGLEADESREAVGALARFVYTDGTEDRDALVPLAAMLSRVKEPIVSSELARRSGELSKLVPLLHPFYRNAGLSLGEALSAGGASAKNRERAVATFQQDWRDALELEASSRTALDALEARGRARP